MKTKIHRLIREKNHILNQWEQYYRRDELESFPIMIQLPTGTRCNIRCRFCTDRSGIKANSGYNDLSFNECSSIIENGAWGNALVRVESIDLYGWGEPLVNPDYEKIFDYLVGKFPGLGINISTNGILFNEKWSEKIVAVDHSIVNFSVNAATKGTFRNLQNSNQFDQVVTNIGRLTDFREKNGKKNPYVSLSYVATTENIMELPQFINLAADLKADCVKVQDVIIINKESERLSLTNEPDLAYSMSTMAKEQAKLRKMQTWFFVTHLVDYFQNSQIQKAENNHFAHNVISEKQIVPSPYFSSDDCFDPWEMFQVSANGEVWPCCQFQNLPEYSLGNIFEQSFQEIWNGEGYKFFRRTINTENPPEVCAICPKKMGNDF
jgi:radical SAM protein with 4Fe4S-binding SPASM domain